MKLHTITVTIDNESFRMTRDGLESKTDGAWLPVDESRWADDDTTAAFDALEQLENLNMRR